MTTGFFGELWQEYRNVAKLLVGTLIELVAILLTLRGEQWLVATLGLAVPPAGSCTLSNFFECLHSFVVDLLVVMLLGSFIVVSAVFIYRRSAHQIRSQQLEEVKEYSKGLVKESNKYNEGLVGAITSMEAGATDQDRIRAIEMLMRLRESYPTDRKVNILLGRLHKIRGDYAAAVEAMTWVIEHKRRHNEATDKDFADFLYNRACYLTLAGRVNEAYVDLGASVALSPENKLDARGDGDFRALREDPRFIQLTT